MKNNLYNILIIALVICLLLSVHQCHHNAKRADMNLTAINDTVTRFKNKLGTQTAGIKTLQLEKSQLNKIILGKDKQLATLAKAFSKVQSIVKYAQVTKYDTIQVPYQDSVQCTFNRTGIIHNNWYSFTYKSNNKGFIIDSLTLPNKTIVLTGFKRKWFLGKETLTTDITNTNPHITITGITSAQVVVPLPLYKKWYIWLGIGLAGGLFAAK